MIRRYIEYYRFDGTDYQPICGSDSIQNFDNRMKTETLVESLNYFNQYGVEEKDIEELNIKPIINQMRFLKEHKHVTHYAIIQGTILENKRITQYHRI